jgi:ATP-dependent Clp protease protease subunit
MNMIPFVIDRDGHGERSYDIYSRLLKERIIFIGGAITDDTANSIIAQMLYLMSNAKNQDINIYINSPGGSVTAGLGIYDTMQFVPCDVATFCVGQAASMGAFLLSAGTSGKRHALQSSRIMIHQPWGGAEGTASDIAIQAKEIGRLKKYLNGRLAIHTKKDLATIEKDTDRDFFMSAQEAKEYGLIDEVVFKLKKE